VDDLLTAACVLQHLKNLQIISMSKWQDENPSDHDYSIFFYNPKKHGDIGLQIIKRKEKYYIPRSTINILSCRHSFNADVIYSECSVKAA